MFRTKEALIPYLLLVAALAGGFLWHESEAIPHLGHTIASGRADIGGPWRLIDQDGRLRTGDDFAGKYRLIYFGYTNCPDVCPTTLGVIAEALDKMGPRARHVVPIFITVDPARDTPAVLKKYMAAFGPRFVGLTGSPAQVAAVEKDFHVYAQKDPVAGAIYAVNHSSVIYLMGPKGRLAHVYDAPISPADLAKDLDARS